MNTAFETIAQTLQALDSGRLTSEALVDAQLARIARLDPRLHAFVDVYDEEARLAARGLDRLRRAGTLLGPLHGITVAVKDLFEIAQKPITGGSRALPPRQSTVTATAVTRLRQAGAIVIGKTHTVEYAFGGWGTNATMGTPWNPWDLATHRVPGGSSSGSAVAVAAGMACAAIGTDTGGSVRIPAGLCGLVGLKTTHGLLSRHGLLELCPTHDTVGPITRSVADCATLLDVLSGPDPLDPVTRSAPSRYVRDDLAHPVAGLRFWTLPDAERADVDAEVLAAYDRAVEALCGMGLHAVRKDLPQRCSESMRIAGALMSAEGYAHLGALFERSDLTFDPHVRRRILLGREIGADRYIALLRERERAKTAMHAAMDGIDCCLFPTQPIAAIPLRNVDELATPLSRFGRFVNLLDLCSVAVPAGLTAAGMPISIQFIGKPLDEARILRIAHAFEQATPWHALYPKGLD